MKEAEKAKIAGDFQAKSTNFDNVARAFAAEVQKKNTELSTRIINEVKAIVAEISREKKLNIWHFVQYDCYLVNINDLIWHIMVLYMSIAKAQKPCQTKKKPTITCGFY
ncbi:MAG: hypothetical protein LBV04_05570 [Deferribacteraceae bacterium]|jgi:hypothetical protein|nr:hypothetical protein [Deferribacteraceae bacterium]